MSNHKWEWIGPHRVIHLVLDKLPVFVCVDCRCRWADKAKIVLAPCCQAGERAETPIG